MSSVSASLINSINATYFGNSQNSVTQSLNAIGASLASNDLAGAQNAFATLQQNLPANSSSGSSQPFGKNTSANADYQNLQDALQSGNTTDAQNALTQLKSDLKGHGGHHHHGGGGGILAALSSLTSSSSSTSSTSTTSSTSSTDDSSTDSDPNGDGSGLYVNVTV